jgi:hypothetical protein
MEREGSSGDMLDELTGFFVESGKSRRQVAKKLKDMALIAVSSKAGDNSNESHNGNS